VLRIAGRLRKVMIGPASSLPECDPGAGEARLLPHSRAHSARDGTMAAALHVI